MDVFFFETLEEIHSAKNTNQNRQADGGANFAQQMVMSTIGEAYDAILMPGKSWREH